MPTTTEPPTTDAIPASLDRYGALLREHFGYPSFRDGQETVLRELLDNDVLAVMPTGSGKSMCYVLPALAVGRTLVVSPLIALMQDQVESLRAAGVAAGFINSTLDRAAQNRTYLDFVAGRLSLLYVAPERFNNDRFVAGLREAGINLLAIDEAHCMSEWGHDFRPDYLTLGSVRERLGSPRTLALTATAEPSVQRDITEHLGFGTSACRVVTSVDRPNLKFAVVDVGTPAHAKAWLLRYLEGRSGQPGIVYARTRAAVDETAEALRGAGVGAAAYHAGMSADDRREVQRGFTHDDFPVIVATNAFGLGVDKSDIRFVVHLNMPGRIESYYQEAGRAGRDGDPAECTLLFNPRDEQAQQFFIDKAHPNDEVLRTIWRQLLDSTAEGGDVGLRRDGDGVDRDGYAIALTAFRHSGLLDQAGRLVSGDRDAPIDAQPVLTHRRYVEDRLGRMVDYAASAGCRHAIILDYFGESAAEKCEACDNCLGEGRSTTVEVDAKLRELLTKLRDRLASRYHRDGSAIMDPRTIRDLATYRPRDRTELLETYGIGEVKADWFGQEIVGVIREWEEAREGGTDRPGRATKRKGNLGHVPPLPFDHALYERLAEWRLGRARADGVPAYVVFSNRTLREIAALRPADVDGLAGVWGVGEARAEHYGTEVISILDAER